MSSGKPPEQIENEIEQTREQLGETVEALAAKTDVKAAARRRLGDVKRKAPALAALGGVGVLVGGFVLVRRRAAQRRAARRAQSRHARVWAWVVPKLRR